MSEVSSRREPASSDKNGDRSGTPTSSETPALRVRALRIRKQSGTKQSGTRLFFKTTVVRPLTMMRSRSRSGLASSRSTHFTRCRTLVARVVPKASAARLNALPPTTADRATSRKVRQRAACINGTQHRNNRDTIAWVCMACSPCLRGRKQRKRTGHCRPRFCAKITRQPYELQILFVGIPQGRGRFSC